MQQAVQFEGRRRTASLRDCSGRRGTDEARSAGDQRTPRAETVRAAGSWLGRFASAIRRMARAGNRLAPVEDHQLSKGWAKRVYLADGARILCRTGKVWITLDQGGEDIVLADHESRSFRPRTGMLVEALAPSRISLEAL